jgi:hypothetical protein
MPFTETLSDCGYCFDPRDCVPGCNRLVLIICHLASRGSTHKFVDSLYNGSIKG